MASPYELATSMLGSSEHANHAALTTYLKNGGVNLDPAKKAWCAAFVNASMAQAGIKGTGSNMARSYLNWGQPTQQPKEGDVAVFSRGDPKGPLGHVGFYKGVDDQGNIRILGGNQSDMVSETTMPASRLLGYRTAGDLAGMQNMAQNTPPNATPIPPGAPNATPIPPGGMTLTSTPAAAPVDPVAAATPPAAEPSMASKFSTALMGPDGKGGADSLAGGLGDIASAFKRKPNPELNTLTPSAPSGHEGGNVNPAQAQALMSAILQSKRTPYGLTLTGGLA